MLLFREHIAITELATADIQTLRIKRIKVGGRIERRARRIWVKLSSNWPVATTFHKAANAVLTRASG